jgi:hypothetical protein
MGPQLKGYQALLLNGSSRPALVLLHPAQHLLRLPPLLPLLPGRACPCCIRRKEEGAVNMTRQHDEVEPHE